jgi:hypothetical protein
MDGIAGGADSGMNEWLILIRCWREGEVGGCGVGQRQCPD